MSHTGVGDPAHLASTMAPAARPSPMPADVIRHVPPGRPFAWLLRGLSDLAACPAASLFYGACLASMGFLLFFYTQYDVKYIAALTSGFLLAGPFVAIGLYDLSRRRERGESCALGPTTIAWHANANNVALFAAVLGVLMLAWTAVALMLFAAFYGDASPTLQEFLADVAAGRRLDFILVYSLVGSLFAALVFAVSVVAIPMMLDRGCHAFCAMRASMLATAQNLPAMIVWAGLVTALTLAGLFTFYLGLIVTMPIIGHASWHAYRDIVDPACPAWD